MGAISPLDGRYRRGVSPLRRFFSEEALNAARLEVELAYFIALSNQGLIRTFRPEEITLLRRIAKSLPAQNDRLKEIERAINHDTKAVEYFIREQITGTTLEDLVEFVHFGLTSADVDNLAWGRLFKLGLEEELFPAVEELSARLAKMTEEYKDCPMLGRTHGQPAVPTTVGQQFLVFASRIRSELNKLRRMEIPGKLGGALGNFQAHRLAFPEFFWLGFAEDFVKSLGLEPKLVTTQIPPYEDLCEIFDALRRINTIVLGLNRDLWDYLSRGYFTLAIKNQEVGSSTMPQKVNPIDFERSEAYLKVANALWEMLARELPQNRLQRDLTDKYLLRVVGEAAAYSYLSWGATLNGLRKLHADREVLEQDLLNHWEILAEAIQIILRKHGFVEAFETVKKLTRGRVLGEKEYRQMLAELQPQVSPTAFAELEKLHPLEVLKWE